MNGGIFWPQLKEMTMDEVIFWPQLKSGYGWVHFLVATKRVVLDGVIF